MYTVYMPKLEMATEFATHMAPNKFYHFTAVGIILHTLLLLVPSIFTRFSRVITFFITFWKAEGLANMMKLENS